MYDGQSWSEPRDLFVAQEGESFNFPSAAVSADGNLQLVWASSGGTYYASAPASQASNVRAWSPAQIIAPVGVVSQPRIVADPVNNVFHVLFTQRIPGTNVSYLKSTDGGQSWSDPIAISQLVPGDPQIPDAVRTTLDSQGRLHVVWSESYPPLFISRHVYYARSDDLGETWTAPTDLADLTRDDDWDAAIHVAVDSQDNVHVVWTCGVNPGRCYRRSGDHGNSWSSAQHLFEGLIGLSGWDSMAADKTGNVFWLGALRYPQAQYSSILNNNRWEEPPQAVITEQDSETLANGHFPQMAINRGNQIHIAFVETDRGPIWYLHGTTSEAAQPLPPTPTPVPTAAPTTQPTEMRPAIVPEPTRRPLVSKELVNPDPGLRPLLWAAGPVVLIALGAIGWTLWRNRH
jgi:hypothetical protein